MRPSIAESDVELFEARIEWTRIWSGLIKNERSAIADALTRTDNISSTLEEYDIVMKLLKFIGLLSCKGRIIRLQNRAVLLQPWSTLRGASSQIS